MTIRQRVEMGLHANPGTTSIQLAKLLGLSVTQVATVLGRMRDVGKARVQKGTYPCVWTAVGPLRPPKPPPAPRENVNDALVRDVVGGHSALNGLGVPTRIAGRPCTLTERLAILSAALDLRSTRAAMAALSGV